MPLHLTQDRNKETKKKGSESVCKIANACTKSEQLSGFIWAIQTASNVRGASTLK